MSMDAKKIMVRLVAVVLMSAGSIQQALAFGLEAPNGALRLDNRRRSPRREPTRESASFGAEPTSSSSSSRRRTRAVASDTATAENGFSSEGGLSQSISRTKNSSRNDLLPENFVVPSAPEKNGGRVLSAEGQNLKTDVKVEFGEGHGETAEEALKEAMRDVLQKVVGVYVDSEFRVNNDTIIKDEILTHSNGFIDHYRKMEEGPDPNGRGRMVTIKAWVKMRDFVNRMQKLAPSQKVQMDGVLLGTDVGNDLNAEEMLRKVFADFSPVRDLLDVELVKSIRPVVQSSSGDMVTMRYVFQIVYSKEKYYRQFLPRVNAVLDQIALKKTTRNVPFQIVKVNVYPSDGAGGYAKYWKERVTTAYYLLNQVNGSTSWDGKGENVISIVEKISPGGAAKVKDWVLSGHLKSVFNNLRQSYLDRNEKFSCTFSLQNEAGEVLATATNTLDYDDNIARSGWARGEEAVDFIPLFDSCWTKMPYEDSTRADSKSSGGTLYTTFDRYVGYIDVTIGREDVSKIRSAEIKLESSKYGE